MLSYFLLPNYIIFRKILKFLLFFNQIKSNNFPLGFLVFSLRL
ncbi:hypothetical protein NEIMUCOT_05680 [Neisseria mucosa ATCC 25996]|uniref:Uncharacterized protein n=1 Tax=Neisseria mucosa (strain ATCC 25996 / DSM 4631 / NCTC 10774 / M26) TaxID=546266 RepID=D2ZYH1_NEIM2|nr:hypothetical protein NEIMUCOT_05680 [Neisseria mucosa ATCC 25996]